MHAYYYDFFSRARSPFVVIAPTVTVDRSVFTRRGSIRS
jgi:hypothetical protein